jgi:hypothetical protein
MKYRRKNDLEIRLPVEEFDREEISEPYLGIAASEVETALSLSLLTVSPLKKLMT